MELETGLDYRTPRLQNKWTQEQRLFLCCLFEFFQRNTRVFKEIFNRVFRLELTECGFTNGIPSSTLRAQWAEMVRYAYPEWREVQQHTTKGHRRWLPTLRQIKKTARLLGLYIVPNYIDDNEETYSQRQSLTPQVDSQGTLNQVPMVQRSDTRDVSAIEVQAQVPEIVDITQIDISLCTGGDKVCFWCVQEQLSAQESEKERTHPYWTDEVPPVIYRWSNIDSQGVNSKTLIMAGLFADGRQFFTPGDIPQEKFNDYFSRHVHIEKTPSPFISTFCSMLAPVHRALWNKEGAIISIINTQKLDTEIYSAGRLFREQNLRIRGYDGRGEFLVWGKIPPAAIICAVKISTIQQLADKYLDIGEFLQLEKLASYKYNRKHLHSDLARGAGKLDRTSGFAIGKFLYSINLPIEFSRKVSEGLFRSWRLKRQGTWESFYEGVDAGYGRSTPSTSVSEAGRPESVEISDDDSATECGSETEDENLSDSELEDISVSPPCMGRELSERYPISTPGWFFIRNTDDDLTTEDEEASGSGRAVNLFSEHDLDRSAEFIADWPEEDTQNLKPLDMSEIRAPTIEMFDPDTGRWVQEQATFQNLDEDDCQSYMQPPSTNGTQEMRGISEVEGESDILHDIETRYSVLSMSRELSEDVLPHIRFARDRERRRRWLLP
ncbi:hypothetical protein ASPBRDRAFT_206747 [Aspergillus brasiliensis CBS 101740]|uniref:DUF7587 domain-containing protein n=1 Tax=Aspergillus brasiliensis (strain CBS 101740 / IMI 381727 / IBT 21946) TaxID=767769 RepID=A0A1L9UMI6_ASPBC|nr:hypothetical protein ASPBRDRAFT_206747 [Aspergillus brasiliensis CBS 101740]